MQSSRDLIVEPVGLDVESLPRPLNWSAIFGNDHPVELEIGTGKGTFLTDQAIKRPEVNFFGIEWSRWFWRYASDRLRRNDCLNVRHRLCRSRVLSQGVRSAGKSFGRSHLFSGSLAEKAAQQTAADSGAVSDSPRTDIATRRPTANRDRPPGLFRTDWASVEEFCG